MRDECNPRLGWSEDPDLDSEALEEMAALQRGPEDDRMSDAQMAVYALLSLRNQIAELARTQGAKVRPSAPTLASCPDSVSAVQRGTA